MDNKSPFELNAKFRNLLPGAIRAAEGGDVVGFATSGRSGVSVGAYQFDLAARPDLRAKLIDIGVKSGLVQDKSAAERLLSLKFDKTIKPGTPEDAAFKTDQKAAIIIAEKIMATSQAKSVIETESKSEDDKLAEATKRVCGKAGPGAKDFCNSPRGQLEVAAYLHQYGYGNTDKIESFLGGKEVELGRDNDDPKTTPKRVKIEGTLDSEQFKSKYIGSTLWGQRNPDGLKGRMDNLGRFFREQKVETESRDNAPKPGAPVAKPEKHSALPADEADAPVQSAEATPTVPASEDENRYIVGWTTQPDMTSRPIWGNEAQYDAYKAQQAEAEASAPAANDPEPAMPQSASLLQQPAPEQNTNFLETASYLPDERSSRGPKVWTPDSGALADAVMQAVGTGLPIWTQMLLGRDAMTNGSRAAVKGLQNAINAATRPPGFDYHWGLGGRTGRIDVDGDLGPLTMAGFGRAVDKHGDKGFARIYALDQFGRYTKGLDTGMSRIGDLEDTLASTLGEVTPDAGARAQETLNIARDMVGDRQRYAPLKVDGWVGPVTSDAFKRAYDTFGSTRLFERFAGPDFWDDGV